MKIVVDTNVLVAGLLTPFGACGEIVRMISSGALVLFYDARILSEYEEVLLSPKFSFDAEKISMLIDYIENSGLAAASLPLPQSLPDQDDEPFLEAAIAGQAECLVTGNSSHFPARLCQGVKVLTPSGFQKYFREQQ